MRALGSATENPPNIIPFVRNGVKTSPNPPPRNIIRFPRYSWEYPGAVVDGKYKGIELASIIRPEDPHIIPTAYREPVPAPKEITQPQDKIDTPLPALFKSEKELLEEAFSAAWNRSHPRVQHNPTHSKQESPLDRRTAGWSDEHRGYLEILADSFEETYGSINEIFAANANTA